MIHKVEMFSVTCDNCGDTFSDSHNGFSAMSDEAGILELMDNEGWYEEEGRDGEPDHHYCPLCHTVNDDDVLCLDRTRAKTP